MDKKTKICIYGLGTYKLLTKSEQDFMGGAELQEFLLGTELVNHNFNVCYIVYDYGQPAHEYVSGIDIYKTVSEGYKIKGLHKLLNVIFLTLKSLYKCNCDIYYYRGVGIDLGLVGIFCLLKRKKLVLSMASNKDLLKSFQKKLSLTEKVSFRIGLKLANCIICQNKEQHDLLVSNFGIQAIQINNMHPVPERLNTKIGAKVIWVGTIKPVWKQPELFLDLAKSIPYGQFQMIGGPSTDLQFYESIKASASSVPNLDFVGFVTYPKVNDYFDDAAILVNTSSVEGFPNTFIQAWLRYVPTVSLNIDPDGVILKNQLGFCSKTFENMVQQVKILLENENLRFTLGNNARKYAEKEFDVKNIIQTYVTLFNNLMG